MNFGDNTTFVVVVILGSLAVLGIAYYAPFHESPAQQQIPSFNRADTMFMGMMIIHHDQAIAMAEMAPNRTDNEAVLSLARNISDAQQAENKQMAAWLRSIGRDRPTNGHRMAGMASSQDMRRLQSSSGQEFDTLFAELMIRHHRGGIQMARSEVRNGQHHELVSLAEDMVRVQQQEVRLMQQWQSEWVKDPQVT